MMERRVHLLLALFHLSEFVHFVPLHAQIQGERESLKELTVNCNCSSMKLIDDAPRNTTQC